MKGAPRVDFLMYVKALPMLLRHPTILAMPVLAAVVGWGLDELAPIMTNAVGGAGAGIFQSIAQVVYLWAFGIAVIQASNAWRGHRGGFDEAWEEARRKNGGILMAAIGFLFVLWVGSYIGSVLLGSIAGILLSLVAAFFLIYTIPAAAIGGLPGQLALTGSVRAVRANVLGAAILAIVFVALWIVVPIYLPLAPLGDNPAIISLVFAGVRALILAYLAFPFAKQYDDVAFRGLW